MSRQTDRRLAIEDDNRNAELSALIKRVQSGCHQAFRSLHTRCRLRLFLSIHRILLDRDAAEEALQETFIKIWARRSQFDPSKGTVDFWTGRIARNTAIDFVRAARRLPSQIAIEDGVEVYEDCACGLPGPMEAAINSGTGEALARLLAKLKPEHRQVLTLAFWADMTHEEISVSLGRPLGTIKSWSRRSQASLRASLAGG